LRARIRELDGVLLQRDRLFNDRQVMQEEMAMARRVQENLLPDAVPELGSYSFSVAYRPAMDIGGDFYDFLRRPNGRILAMLADISGHGIQAALGTSLLKFAFQSLSGVDGDLGDLARTMNGILDTGLPVGNFVAATIYELDPKAHCCRILNCGLPHPILYRGTSGAAELITAEGLLLGAVDGAVFEPGEVMEVALDSGDRIIGYTDGLTEAENSDGEQYGGRILSAVEAGATTAGDRLVHDVIEDVSHHTNRESADDDMTILILQSATGRR
jgi:sigma-B regulation protein RsbU (phosphoserine phosphatase)